MNKIETVANVSGAGDSSLKITIPRKDLKLFRKGDTVLVSLLHRKTSEVIKE
jgi:hypothetical protein